MLASDALLQTQTRRLVIVPGPYPWESGASGRGFHSVADGKEWRREVGGQEIGDESSWRCEN